MNRFVCAMIVGCVGAAAGADVVMYGDADLCNTGTYGSDPTAGAATSGLAAGVTNWGTSAFGHAYPFSPSGDYAGTDQIYVGSVQTASHDGYSNSSQRINGPQVITLDYSALVANGIGTFTLGIMTDDFQNPSFGQAFTASINGQVNQVLTDELNRIDEGGPVARFLSIGLDVNSLAGNNVLTLTIDQGGDGGDGLAVDFLTVGITSVPAPSSAIVLLGAGLISRRRR